MERQTSFEATHIYSVSDFVYLNHHLHPNLGVDSTRKEEVRSSARTKGASDHRVRRLSGALAGIVGNR